MWKPFFKIKTALPLLAHNPSCRHFRHPPAKPVALHKKFYRICEADTGFNFYRINNAPTEQSPRVRGIGCRKKRETMEEKRPHSHQKRLETRSAAHFSSFDKTARHNNIISFFKLTIHPVYDFRVICLIKVITNKHSKRRFHVTLKSTTNI